MIDAGVVQSSMETVERIFREHRDVLLSSFGNTTYRVKDDHTPVTELDIALEKTIRDALLNEFSNLGFQGEETGHTGSTDAYWCVDPIDGTSSYIRGMPYATNMAALIVDGETRASLIYDFVHDILYTAKKGEGAFRNGEPLRIVEKDRFHDHVVFSLGGALFSQLREALHELNMKALLPLTASGYAYTMLAEGKIDGVAQIDPGALLHDMAPGVLLAEEAGFVLYNLEQTEGIARARYIIGRPGLVARIEASGLL